MDGHLLRAGQVGSPHGLDGSFHVTDPVPALLALGESVVVRDVARVITRRAGHERRLILRIAECEDRTAAQALRGAELMVPRERAPALQDDEWWAEDLEGCAVHDGQVEVGIVRRLLALPSCEVLAVERAGGAGELLVPLVADAVRTVDVAARRIDVDLAFLGES
ncbi:MAG TPA: ribosome maturation factor RimM [Solirubrobacteraceae bacterium]|nr:ribosome maturation factor RimM [Solirubrobacteraceae bacterium]